MPSPLPPGIEVTVDNHVLAEANYGQPHFSKPGKIIKVHAKAPGCGEFNEEFSVKKGDERKVAVTLQCPPRP
jgi:hypothetical protein